MSSLFLGLIGFCFLIIFDVCQILNRKRLAVITSVIGYLSVLGALLILVLSGTIRSSSRFILIPEIIVTGIFFLLTLYSILIEVPFISTYQSPEKRTVFQKGTYGLVRHPGFLWFFFMLCSLNFLFQAPFFLRTSLFLVIMNFILISMEDKFFFPALFSDYYKYKKKVPFIIPKMKFTKNWPES